MHIMLRHVTAATSVLLAAERAVSARSCPGSKHEGCRAQEGVNICGGGARAHQGVDNLNIGDAS